MPKYEEITPPVGDPVVISPLVSSHIFENQILVFSERNQTIYELNPSAAFIWLCCEKRMLLSDITREVSQIFGINTTRAETDIAEVISQWSSLELVENKIGEEIAPLATKETEPPEGGQMVGLRHDIDLAAYKSFYMRLAGFDFLMRFSHQEIEHLVTPVFAHLGCCSADQPIIFDIVKTDNQFLIVNDGLIVAVFSNPAEIVPKLSYCIMDAAYRKIDLGAARFCFS